MDAEHEMQSVRFSLWNKGVFDIVRAEWTEAAVPSEMVHYLLGWIDNPAGTPVRRLDGLTAVRVYCEITFRVEDLPF